MSALDGTSSHSVFRQYVHFVMHCLGTTSSTQVPEMHLGVHFLYSSPVKRFLCIDLPSLIGKLACDQRNSGVVSLHNAGVQSQHPNGPIKDGAAAPRPGRPKISIVQNIVCKRIDKQRIQHHRCRHRSWHTDQEAIVSVLGLLVTCLGTGSRRQSRRPWSCLLPRGPPANPYKFSIRGRSEDSAASPPGRVKQSHQGHIKGSDTEPTWDYGPEAGGNTHGDISMKEVKEGLHFKPRVGRLKG